MFEQKNHPADSNRYTVRIMGDEYIISGNSTPEYMEMIASYTEEQLQRIASKDLKLNKSQIAILAALKIADELHKLRQEYQYLDQLLKEAR